MDALDNSLGPIMAIFGAVSLVMSIFFIICTWIIFKKMGEPGWKCLIPIYNGWVSCKHVVGAGWKMFLMGIPVFGLFYSLYFAYKLFDKFGFSTVATILFLLFPFVGLPVAAFSSAEWSE